MRILRTLLALSAFLATPVWAANPYYTHGSFPNTGSPATSAGMRAELDSITAGFNLLPQLSGNGSQLITVNSGGTALIPTGFTFAQTGNITFSGAYNLTLTMTGATTLTLPLTGTLATLAGVETLTNKTWNGNIIGVAYGGTNQNTTTWSAIPVVTAGNWSQYGGTSCTNQFVRSLSSVAAATCSTVQLATDTAGVLGAANGGTGANTAASSGVPIVTAGVWTVSGALSGANGGVPTGAVLPFNLGACPAGFTEYTPLRGRYVVGLPAAGTLNGTSGTALTDTESRPVGQHTHTITTTDPGHTHSLPNVISQNAGGGTYTASATNGTVATVTGSGTTGISDTAANTGSVAGTNAPYLQLLMCQKS